MTCWALVPIKEGAACKTRLAHVLSEESRHALVRALLNHVIGTLRSTPGIDHILLVTSHLDATAARGGLRGARRARRGALGQIGLFARERNGLNEDLEAALKEAARGGAGRAVIIPADLPLLKPADVNALLTATKHVPMAIGPDRHRRGTNALAVNLPSPIDLAFGENSFPRHVAAARARRIEPAVLRRPGIAFDVDNAEDLTRLRRYRSWSALVKELAPGETRTATALAPPGPAASLNSRSASRRQPD